MVGALIAVVVVVGVVLLIAMYMTLLTSLYPEQIRTNEVLHLRTNDLWVLRVCRYRKSRASGEPVLLVHGMGANQNNFTSPENGCLVDYLSEKGYDCWTVDLRGSRSSEPPFERTRDEVRMEDFFMEDLPAVIRHILKTTHYTKLHWIGHSMGGMLLYAYAQAHGGSQLASGTTLGAPIDFTDASKQIPAWLLGFGEKCPVFAGNVIRGCIPILKALHVAPLVFPVNSRNLPKKMHAGHFINMIEDPLPELMRQVKNWMKTREYTLLDGEMDVAAGLPAFPVPLLAFYAAVDPFIKAENALKVFESINLEDKKSLVCSKENGYVENYSHCDLAFGREAEREIFEPIAKWLAEHPCPKRHQDDEEPGGVSATLISPEKRAHILSGAAYSHLKASETAQPLQKEPEEGKASEISLAEEHVSEKRVSRVVVTKAALRDKPETGKTTAAAKAVAKPAAKPAVKPSPKPAAKPAAKPVAKPAAKPAAKPVAKPAAKPAAKPTAKAAPAKTISTAKAKPTAASANTPKKKSNAAPPTALVAGGIELSPEALARAEAIRAARNMSISKLVSNLEEPSPRKK